MQERCGIQDSCAKHAEESVLCYDLTKRVEETSSEENICQQRYQQKQAERDPLMVRYSE